ncbi:MAG: phosphonoacetaldehyde hydrolase [Anaerolineae bacterium]|nr:phosphonoacetaldehyde hydrolase [Anaerolineae bacterium]
MRADGRARASRVQGVIFDWAGTTVDYGCFAPTMVFVDGFRAHGVQITMGEARAPMGLHKRDHIAAVLAIPRVRDAWTAAHGAAPTDADIQRVFEDFAPRQVAVVAQYAEPIPGVVEMAAALRTRGVKIGSTTGYTRPMLDALMPVAAEHGYEPDVSVTADEVPAARPAPWMAFLNAMKLGIYPMSALVKVGDTPSDIAEGLNANMWTVGIAQTGNELGMSAAQAAALSPAELEARLHPIHDRLHRAGAHYVIDSAADLLPVLDDIERRLATGEMP